ncbi:MAG: phage major capsid protein, partial [Bacteroidales bacterium]|nr:phage major capsid protein [Bacteroidales bacterium]
MNPQELMNQITNLGNQIRTAAAALAARAADNSVSIADLEAEQARLNDMNKRLAALQAAYDTAVAAQATGMSGAAGMQRQQGGDSSGGQQSRNLGEMLRSNEYARAFAFALQNGLNRRTARQHEETRILYDALTEGGGNPTGADGGFLVPEDIDHSIRELRR